MAAPTCSFMFRRSSAQECAALPRGRSSPLTSRPTARAASQRPRISRLLKSSSRLSRVIAGPGTQLPGSDLFDISLSLIVGAGRGLRVVCNLEYHRHDGGPMDADDGWVCRPRDKIKRLSD